MQRWARIDLMRAAALTGRWGRVLELIEAGASPDWAAHASVHAHRLVAWPGAPQALRSYAVASKMEPRFTTLVDLFTRARGDRPFDGEPVPSVRAAVARFAERAAPHRRAQRFIQQLTAEVFATAGHPGEALESVEEAVQNGLVDVTWMDRLPLFEGLRGTARFAAARADVAARADAVLAAWRGPTESLESALASIA